MGLFDYVRCHAPLPVEWPWGNEFQSKTTPRQFCDDYEIRKDGTLWYRARDPDMPQSKWRPEPFTGVIFFSDFHLEDRVEFVAVFKDGRLTQPIVEVRRDPKPKYYTYDKRDWLRVPLDLDCNLMEGPFECTVYPLLTAHITAIELDYEARDPRSPECFVRIMDNSGRESRVWVCCITDDLYCELWRMFKDNKEFPQPNTFVAVDFKDVPLSPEVTPSGANTARQSVSVTRPVLELLTQNPGVPFEVSEVAKHIQAGSASSINSALQRLAADGKITKIGRGRYVGKAAATNTRLFLPGVENTSYVPPQVSVARTY